MKDRVLIIAEAGVNHNGLIDYALKLVDAASNSGADYVKFQTFKAEKLVSKEALKAEYQKRNTGNESASQLEMLRKLELTPEMHLQLISYCKSKGVKFLSSPFDIESADFLLAVGLEIFKIPSGEITNIPFLKHIGSFNKNIILSTGMSTLEEVEFALNSITQAGTPIEKITVLQCNTEYPTPYKDVNLMAMQTMRKTLGVKVGYSDHTEGIEIPIAAVALGAKVIEKHFTLDRNMEGPDHKASLEPDELKQMVRAIRNVENSLGDGIKKPSESEQKNITIARKSLHYSRNLMKGSILTKNDVTIKRPGNGIPPVKIDTIIGQRLLNNVFEDTIIKPEDFL
jgi:N-acetylneuraminate synthase